MFTDSTPRVDVKYALSNYRVVSGLVTDRGAPPLTFYQMVIVVSIL